MIGPRISEGIGINEKGIYPLLRGPIGPRKRRGDCASDRTAYLRWGLYTSEKTANLGGDYVRLGPRICEGTACE